MSEAASGGQTVAGRLRAAWEPERDRLRAVDTEHPTNIRVHRALSWLDAAEAAEADAEATDERVLFRWIAFNALYNRWDEKLLRPCGDQDSFRAFLAEAVALDAAGAVAGMLEAHKRLVLTLLDNKFLKGQFWKDPSVARSLRWTPHRQTAQQHYANKRWGELLEAAFEPVYFLRCQLVHGAATRRSSMNRDGLRHADDFLRWAVPLLVAVVIDRGMDENWGPLCYPPQV
ncbi:HEPN domain-containing protein [Phycisphaera mikurensis]|uniref:Uncharacterized protein n=1 Tax=Phycisphaera mikurensis (strain NBRC 102666 / KCTC 22515 / FYK2301M01) TaxID=1142394 RepID=I0IJ66_PHYMF|nr:HEPN domain-containing protein [Phycisphaera mikurensis]MBB6443276.1 hypothetical protein [Phycisphaera mikurensis]BAM05304.1 hypothetical protein PSMK_31450 [Phycisphaera mikurensis NBRC 102666]